MRYRTLDPSSAELVREFPFASEAEVESTLTRAAAAAPGWRDTPLDARCHALRRAADALDDRNEELAGRIALEMGKPVEQGRAEVSKCAWVCRHYADHAAHYLAPVDLPSDGSRAYVRYEPLGPLLAVMPWNFPLWQVFRFAAPSLVAGNVAILKPAPNTPQCGLAVAEVLEAAAFPPGVFEVAFLSNTQAADVIADRRVRGVTLTGSDRAGRAVGAAAGNALKPVVLELGGSDPFVVFADADLEDAVETGVTSRCLNTGQTCISAKRFIVERDVCDRFLGRFAAAMAERTVGDPRDPSTDIGPMAREDLRTTLSEQVRASIDAGGRIVYRGEVPPGPGFYFPPTVLTEVAAEAAGRVEELFGPVAVVVPFASEREAVELADETRYGLGASIWTSDAEKARRVAHAVDAGAVFVNGLVKSDPRLPFGGVKGSGFGRELGREGAIAFTNAKTVWIK